MFTELSKILRKGDTLGITVGLESDGKCRVNVMPKLFTLDGERGGDRRALNTPITITGTPEELDSPAFAEQLTRFTTSVNPTRHTIDEAETTHKAPPAAAKSKPVPAKPAPTGAPPK